MLHESENNTSHETPRSPLPTNPKQATTSCCLNSQLKWSDHLCIKSVQPPALHAEKYVSSGLLSGHTCSLDSKVYDDEINQN